MKINVVVLLFCIFCLTKKLQGDLLLCTEDFCEDYLNKKNCTSLSCHNEKNSSKVFTVPSPITCNCCDYCLLNLDPEETCSVGDVSSNPPNKVCGHGLACDSSSSQCERMDSTPCTRKLNEYDKDKQQGLVGYMQLRPKCDRDGDFEPTFCVPGEICYCLSKDGQRIFGEVSYNVGFAKPLKCECSRLNYEAAKFQGAQLHHGQYFRCKANGDYDSLQCMGDQCFCIEPVDGRPGDDIEFVNITSNNIIDQLPCYDNKTHHKTYFRTCEELYKEELEEFQQHEKNDTSIIGFALPNCQLDGNFGPVQEDATTKFCADPSGRMLENFQVSKLKEKELADTMNCKCARSRSLITSSEKPECLPNGNYKPIQCRRGLCRCVDENGAQTEIEKEHIVKCLT